MKNKINIIDKMINILIIVLFSSFFLLSNLSYGSIIIFGICILILFLIIFKQNGIISLHFNLFHLTILLMSLFSIISSFWAINSSLSISKSITFLSIFICMTIVYMYFDKQNSVNYLIKDILIGGNIVLFYIIILYGVPNIISWVFSGIRLPSDFLNSNTIGILGSLCSIISFDFILKKQYRKSNIILVIINILMIAVSGSRKAIVMFILGILLLIFFKSIDNKSFKKALVSGVFTILILSVAIYFILQLPMFELVSSRLKAMIETLLGGNNTDNSSNVRIEMIQLGISYFLKNPILGIGVGNTSEILLLHFGYSSYLHNNFIELLASGGIVLFLIYYSIWFNCIYNFIKLRKFRDKNYYVCFILLILLLLMDFGMVSYYSKETYLYLMLFYLYVDNLKLKKKQYLNNCIEEDKSL